jgi:hypothetical protein
MWELALLGDTAGAVREQQRHKQAVGDTSPGTKIDFRHGEIVGMLPRVKPHLKIELARRLHEIGFTKAIGDMIPLEAWEQFLDGEAVLGLWHRDAEHVRWAVACRYEPKKS